MKAIWHDSAHLALRRAVELIGSQSAFERVTGAKQQKVSYWLRDGMILPGEYVIKTEAATGISRHVLRPDLYPDETGHDVAPADDRRRPSEAGVMEPLR